MSNYSLQIEIDTPAVYWPMHETSGTVIKDASQIHFDGTVIGGVTLGQESGFDAGLIPTFNGTTGWVQFPAGLAVGGAFSVEAWVKTATNHGSGAGLLTKYDGPSTSGYGLGLNGTHAQFFCFTAAGASIFNLTGAAVINDGAWHHIVGVYDLVNARIYVDGNQDAIVGATTVPNSSAGTAALACYATTGGTPSNFYTGGLAEVAVYTVALTAAQAARHYQARIGSTVTITINSVDRTQLVRRYESEILDNAGATPNTASVVVRGFTPTNGLTMHITQGLVVPIVLFDGEVTSVQQIATKTRQRVRYRLECIDGTFKMNRRLVTKAWLVATSITTVLTDILSGFTTGVTSTNVQASLANAPVPFLAVLEPVTSVIQRLADLAGAAWKYLPINDLYFRVTSTIINPAALTTLNKTFKSLIYRKGIVQAHTRMYATGAGTSVVSSVPAGSTYAPVTLGVLFAAAGGSALTGAQILTYTSVVLGGVIAAPVATWGAITLVNDGGAGGLTIGATYIFALTYVTPSGETVISNVSGSPASPPDATHRRIVINWTDTVPTSATGIYVYASTDAGATWKKCVLIAASPISPYAITAQVDTAIGAAPPTISTAGNDAISGSTTTGSTAVGATTIAVAETGVFGSGGGILTYAVAGVVYSATYTGRSIASGAGNITGVPASGLGSIVATIPSGAGIQNVPGIKGIPGSGTGAIASPLSVGDSIVIFVQRDDATAQTALGALEGGDGIHEFSITDSSLESDAACNARGDAELSLAKNPEEEASFLSEDVAMVSSALVPISINGISTTLSIRRVRISWVPARKNPQREVTASSQYKTLYQYLAEGAQPGSPASGLRR